MGDENIRVPNNSCLQKAGVYQFLNMGIWKYITFLSEILYFYLSQVDKELRF